jgi:hypothetical protein
MAVTVDLTADIIDIRDIIERIEELESDLDGLKSDSPLSWQEFAQAYAGLHPHGQGQKTEELEELCNLLNIMAELAGNGGDEQWQGDWYPQMLIRDHHFVDYCRELCEDIGAVPRDLPAYIAIDWDETARNLMSDYSSVEIPCNNRWVSYFYR